MCEAEGDCSQEGDLFFQHEWGFWGSSLEATQEESNDNRIQVLK